VGDRPFVEMPQCLCMSSTAVQHPVGQQVTYVLLGCALMFACMLLTCAPPGSLLVSGSSAGCEVCAGLQRRSTEGC
jgi:hypothetical protein